MPIIIVVLQPFLERTVKQVLSKIRLRKKSRKIEKSIEKRLKIWYNKTMKKKFGGTENAVYRGRKPESVHNGTDVSRRLHRIGQYMPSNISIRRKSEHGRAWIQICENEGNRETAV